MSKRNYQAELLHYKEAEKWAFGVSTAFGRAWKTAYQEAKRCHTVLKAVEIAAETAIQVRGGKK